MAFSTFSIKTIESDQTVVDKLTVHSYEMSIYLVELEVNGVSGLVYKGDKPMRFFSSQDVRNAFANCKVLKAQMSHESPYDEMIGNPQSAQKASVLPFSMGQPY
ncbi:MAG: DUF6482 family protein [Paraglaciecola sp.]|uniref:DUF6482 family protein n=1 Tax=Paraglaciecola sp. TaxID=1920173 RepID=UPI003296BA71